MFRGCLKLFTFNGKYFFKDFEFILKRNIYLQNLIEIVANFFFASCCRRHLLNFFTFLTIYFQLAIVIIMHANVDLIWNYINYLVAYLVVFVWIVVMIQQDATVIIVVRDFIVIPQNQCNTKKHANVSNICVIIFFILKKSIYI